MNDLKFTSAGDFLKSQEPVKQFIAAMDNSGGSAGGVLDLSFTCVPVLNTSVNAVNLLADALTAVD